MFPKLLRPERDWLERLTITVALVIFFFAGYLGAGRVCNPTQARDLTLPLDRKIPFIAASVWVYLWLLPAVLLPVFLVKCPRLFRRIALAYATAIAISVCVFVVFPVSATGLRIDPKSLNQGSASEWAVFVVYSLDSPYNLFPSLHVSLAAVAALSTWKAAKRYGLLVFVAVPLVSASVCTIKQHFLLDVAGGLVVATVVGASILVPYRPRAGETPAYSWHGPVAYLMFLGCVYAGFYGAYLARS